MTEREALMCLNAVPGLGSVTMNKLTEFFENAQGGFDLNQGREAWGRFLRRPAREALETFSVERFLKEERALLEQHGVAVLIKRDADYPFLLKEIPDPPQILYIKGDARVLQSLSVSIVGSRQCSVYGLSVAEELAGRCASLGITVVSGLARGIDTAAHRGAMKAGGATVAVLGNGLSRIYPPENAALADEIASSSGALVSEFSMATPPHAGNFPRRNRVISGLALGTVVVEAAERSGALITVRYALEQGREVFAVPGPIHRRTSIGVHQLIKQGAKIVCGVEDILEELAPRIRAGLGQNETMLSRKEVLSEAEHNVFKHLSDDPVHFEHLAALAQRPAAEVMGVISSLECGHWVRRVKGNFFVRSHNVVQ
ncbi:MAG TPA: DNA-processing protein DprA [Candidatus Omnitrophota bacterium]|nr:DNA-processing protein DprA [Candidatus Omnitrophota bacterium]HSA31139.1 DNA-processing protein DprA [Candidatus Omnitrophota bacterium]